MSERETVRVEFEKQVEDMEVESDPNGTFRDGQLQFKRRVLMTLKKVTE